MASELTIFSSRCHSYTMPLTITIKELHRATGEAVRRAGASRVPVVVTDRGEPVAVLANPFSSEGAAAQAHASPPNSRP
jgi:prevent-host-death family protein